MEDSVVEASRNCDEQEATESKPTEWTDEKHSLYLKSMETTFVNQLYKSLDLLGRNSQKNCPSGSKASQHEQASTCGPSSQFKVLRDGCWSKINFRRDEAEVNQVEPSGVLANLWIQHYRCSERRATRKCSSRARDPLPSTTVNQYPAHNFQLWRQDSVGSDTEVTDQNFSDEDLEKEKSGRTHEMKRTRTSSDTVLSNDQVVPFENIVEVDDAAEDHLHRED